LLVLDGSEHRKSCSGPAVFLKVRQNRGLSDLQKQLHPFRLQAMIQYPSHMFFPGGYGADLGNFPA
jgi:hypothetical protein